MFIFPMWNDTRRSEEFIMVLRFRFRCLKPAGRKFFPDFFSYKMGEGILFRRNLLLRRDLIRAERA
ncbi:hypothetical protein ACO0LO_18205 [Undibacterium sp. TJN25]|uniref:hypothetical protein n=1 Tax=Undibacterium sp. TJN25 TaxID=3413056 RepID=UPI003BF095B3